MQTKEIHELRQDKVELREQVKEHKDLAQEWKIIVKEKSESLQKTIEDLTIEKAKVSELVQKFGINNHDSHGISSFSIIEQEHVDVSNKGEGALENQILD
jgi:cell division protein FtsL